MPARCLGIWILDDFKWGVEFPSNPTLILVDTLARGVCTLRLQGQLGHDRGERPESSNGPLLKLAEDGPQGREVTTMSQLEICATYIDYNIVSFLSYVKIYKRQSIKRNSRVLIFGTASNPTPLLIAEKRSKFISCPPIPVHFKHSPQPTSPHTSRPNDPP